MGEISPDIPLNVDSDNEDEARNKISRKSGFLTGVVISVVGRIPQLTRTFPDFPRAQVPTFLVS